MKRIENLIVEEYGTLDDNFRVKLRVLAQQPQTEAIASLATPNQGARPTTATSRKATGSDKPLTPIMSPTNTNTATKECKTPPPAVIQGLKKGVEVTTPQKAEAFERSSVNMQGNRNDLTRDKDITPHQTTSKSMPQKGAKKVQA